MDPIQKAVFDTIHSGKLAPGDLADLFGVSENMVYKMAYEDSGLVRALKRAVALMRSQKRYDILRVINAKTGRLSVSIPRVPASRLDENELVAGLQQVAHAGVQALMTFFANPTEANKREMIGRLNVLAEESIGIRKAGERYGQLELGGGGER